MSLGEVEEERVFCKVKFVYMQSTSGDLGKEKGPQVILYQHSLFFRRRREGASNG